MTLADLILQPFNFIFVVGTLLILYTVVSPFIADTAGITNMFTDLCAKGGLSIISDLDYNAKTALIQFITPQGTDMDFTYPRNTFDILSSVFDTTKNNIKTEANPLTMAGLSKTRVNSYSLERCYNAPCFCAVRTDMEFLTLNHADYTACFPRLYAYDRDAFDTCIQDYYASHTDTLTDYDYAAFTTCVDTVLSQLSGSANEEAQAITNCYNFFDTYNYAYDGTIGSYVMTLNNAAGNLEDGDGADIRIALQQFYSLTKAGLFTEVVKCVEIPSDGECLCPLVSGNQMVSSNGVFLAVAGSKYEQHELAITSFIMQLEKKADSCIIDTLPSQS